MAIQLEKSKSRDNLKPKTALHDKNKKPYRSEMNLQLSYDGTNSTITQAISGQANTSDSHNSKRAKSLERDTTDSPSPHVPDAMAPFPNNKSYIGFEQLNKVAAGKRPDTPVKPPPPLPPARIFSPLLNGRTAAALNSGVGGSTDSLKAGSNGMVLSPNKSNLYATIANAASKRSQFRTSHSHMTRSLDTDLTDAAEQEKQAEALALEVRGNFIS